MNNGIVNLSDKILNAADGQEVYYITASPEPVIGIVSNDIEYVTLEPIDIGGDAKNKIVIKGVEEK